MLSRMRRCTSHIPHPLKKNYGDSFKISCQRFPLTKPNWKPADKGAWGQLLKQREEQRMGLGEGVSGELNQHGEPDINKAIL